MAPIFKISSIEGNIGSGKSTLLDALRKMYKDNKCVIFLREPVDDWEKIKDSKGNTMLKKFYADQHKYSFPFQMMAYISRLKILRDAVKTASENPELENKVVHIITERSLYTDQNVFAKMLFDQGKIEDVCYKIYLNWFDEFAKDYPLDSFIVVNTDPRICYERIHKRCRDGEEVIPLSYLEACHRYHKDFLSMDNWRFYHIRRLNFDGNIDIFENDTTMPAWLCQVNMFLGTEQVVQK